MASYSFLTLWRLAAPRQAVWDVLADVEGWPAWWPAVESARELAAGDARRVGSRYRVLWRAPIGYRVELDFEVDEVDEPKLMSGHARGDLEGTGVWQLREEDGLTSVTYAWNVVTTKRWMNALGPLPRPLFRWSHDRVMAGGGDGLATRL